MPNIDAELAALRAFLARFSVSERDQLMRAGKSTTETELALVKAIISRIEELLVQMKRFD